MQGDFGYTCMVTLMDNRAYREESDITLPLGTHMNNLYTSNKALSEAQGDLICIL